MCCESQNGVMQRGKREDLNYGHSLFSTFGWIICGNKMNLSNFFKRQNFLESALLLCFCLCAFFQCIQVKVSNLFQILVYLFFVLYLIKNPQEIKTRFKRFQIFFLIYLIYAILEFLPVLTSPDIFIALGVWSRTYLMRGVLFLVLLLSFKNWRPYFLVFFSLVVSFSVDSIACLFIDPLPKFGGRVTGFFGHPMIYAGFACIVLPFFFYKALQENILFKKLACIAFCFAFLVLLVLNGTRGAWLAVGASFIVMLLFFKFSFKSLLIVFCIASSIGVGSLYTSEEVSSRMKTLTSSEIYLKSERILLWKSSYKMFQDHPFFGVGLGAYGDQYKNKYIDNNAKERNLTRAHSNIFQLLGESGLSGLIGYLLLFGFLLLNSFRNFTKFKQGIYVVIFVSTLCLFLQGLTEYNLGHSAVMKFYWLWVGALFPLSLYLRNQNENWNSL